MSAPIVKGWCPGARKPMLSGDGLIVRVRPFRAELSKRQALDLCDLAQEFGNGMLDLTSRANLQIRGISENNHASLLNRLADAGLLDHSEKAERHRNILMPHDWQPGDLASQLHDTLVDALDDFPDLPGKMGFALDCSDRPQLQNGSADFRIEQAAEGLILRADGDPLGKEVPADPKAIVNVIRELAVWFLETDGATSGRMSRHLKRNALPQGWSMVPPLAKDARTPVLGPTHDGQIVGAPFGKIEARAFRDALLNHDVQHVRLLLDRKLFLCGSDTILPGSFVTQSGDRLMSAHACPGAPLCSQASVETLSLAQSLAARTSATLHVSGCAKGCAHAKPADLTLVGRDGRFDLVRQGTTWDTPVRSGIHPNDLGDLIGNL